MIFACDFKKTPKNLAKTSPNPSKTMPGTSLRLPKHLQDASRTLQDDSSWPQDASRTLQDAPKTRPRCKLEAKILPRYCQDPPEIDFGLFWEAFGNVFLYPALIAFRKCETKFRSKVPLSKCRSHNVSKISSTDDGGLRVAVSILRRMYVV